MAGDPLSASDLSSATPVVGSVEPDSDPSEDAPRDLATPLAYAHAGRRRRRITEELFRCKLSLEAKGEVFPCNALVWRTPEKMRSHLLDHMTEDDLSGLTDDQVRAMYIDAARLPQEGIPDDE